MINLNEWKQDIEEHYRLLQSQLREAKSSELYRGMQAIISKYNAEGRHKEACVWNELVDSHFNLSDIYNQFHWLHSERLEWLREYTGRDIEDNELYRNMAYKIIHDDVMVKELIMIKSYNSSHEISLEV